MDSYGWKIKTWQLNQVEQKNAWMKNGKTNINSEKYLYVIS